MSETFPAPTPEGAPIPTTMRAVVVHGPEDYRLEERPVPVPGEGDILLRTESVGVCASDVKCYHGAARYWGDDKRPAWAERDRIPGHEFAGTVVSGDPAALERRGLALGDRVVCEQIVPCGDCLYCDEGSYWMCNVHDMFGFKGFDGAMAEYVLVPARGLTHKVSRDIEPFVAAFAEPLSCALHAVDRAGIRFQDTVVVAGAGPIGLSAIAGARQKNPLQLIALDVVDDKLELAREIGADVVINIAKEDAIARVKELTGGYGADVYIEATGHPSAVSQGLEMLRKLGRFIEYSVFKEPVSVDWSIISDDKELDVRGAHLGPHTWPPAIKMLEKQMLPMDRICSHQFPLERYQEALDLVGSVTDPSVKVSLVF